MSLIAAVLIITSAFMHASWNFISKRRSPSLAFFFIMALSGAVIMSPFLYGHRHVLPLVPASVWGLILATGVAQLIYFSGLAGAYQRGDISLAYPLARALPVLMIAAISILLGRGGEIGTLSLFGMLLITAGCVILPLPHFQSVRLGNYFRMVYLMVLIAAIGTTGYTLIDDQALRQLRETPAISLSNREITLLFISLQTISTAVMIGTGTMLHSSGRNQLTGILRSRSLLTAGVLTGVVVMATYGLVLASMAYVTDVSYVAAFRQLSIPIGAMLGFTLQKEPRYLPKILGIVIISIGLIFVGIG
jgi:drug/metabolite transporter (DMT)-like permease